MLWAPTSDLPDSLWLFDYDKEFESERCAFVFLRVSLLVEPGFSVVRNAGKTRSKTAAANPTSEKLHPCDSIECCNLLTVVT
jgi:hypothetical protein